MAAVGAGVLALDQLTKFAARRSLPETTTLGHDELVTINRYENHGSLGAAVDVGSTPSLIAGAGVALAATAGALVVHAPMARVGLALLAGGAASNLVDRATRDSVTDMISLYHGNVQVNVADVASVAGAGLVLAPALRWGWAHA